MADVIFDPENFRTLYPAFSDETKYSNELLTEYFGMAAEFVGKASVGLGYVPSLNARRKHDGAGRQNFQRLSRLRFYFVRFA